MTFAANWLMKATLAGLGLLFPLIASATTTETAIPAKTVERTTFAYGAGSVRAASENTLAASETWALYVPSFGKVTGLVAAKSGQMVHVGERVTVQEGQFVNRIFDSRAGQAGANVSGPLGRSFSPGSGVPTTASEAIQQRGLNIFYPNNAQEAIIMRARGDIPAIQRTSIGGTTPELLIEPQYWNQLETIRQFSLPAGTP